MCYFKAKAKYWDIISRIVTLPKNIGILVKGHIAQPYPYYHCMLLVKATGVDSNLDFIFSQNRQRYPKLWGKRLSQKMQQDQKLTRQDCKNWHGTKGDRRQLNTRSNGDDETQVKRNNQEQVRTRWGKDVTLKTRDKGWWFHFKIKLEAQNKKCEWKIKRITKQADMTKKAFTL